MAPEPKEVEDLAIRADLLRGRLLHGIAALDGRRRELVELGHVVQRRLEVVAGVGALVVVAGVGVLSFRAFLRGGRARRDRWVLPAPPAREKTSSVLGALMKSAVTAIATTVARRLLESAIATAAASQAHEETPTGPDRLLAHGNGVAERVRA